MATIAGQRSSSRRGFDGVPRRSFDLVVSTLSMHHWADPTAGLTEIGRVLRPGGRALVWDFRPGVVPLHRHVPDPVDQMHASSLRVGHLDALAVALEVRSHPAGRAGPGR
jgi:SAM-dependent methyltransferase